MGGSLRRAQLLGLSDFDHINKDGESGGGPSLVKGNVRKLSRYPVPGLRTLFTVVNKCGQ
jgi:hypothetical protein